jgi:hypothetical protein
MHRPIASILMLAFALVWNLGGATSDFVPSQTGTQQGEKKAPSKAKSNSASLTGCIDEQEGHYVLLDDQTRDPKASLEAEGFETEGFAKYVGHKVTVRGTSNSEGTRPVFRVRSIESISDTCGPQLAH